jgi:drug/metabolite transporter (DMT)-like permease
MMHRHDMDRFGAAALIAIMMVLAVNQVVIKLTNEGLQPVFAAGLRSAGAIFVLWGWLRLRGQRLDFRRGTIGAGVLVGLIFSVEFLALFIALDLTTVTRVSVIFYSMPVWMAVAAHFLLPGERLTPLRSLGLALAFAGVAWAIVDRSGLGGEASLVGDLAALVAAWGWMAVSLTPRLTRIREVTPEMQMMWQVLVSAPVLIGLSFAFGPLIRDFVPATAWMMLFQIVVVASGVFLAWFWLLTHYKASQIAAFAFLSPVFGVIMGWLWLNEPVTPSLLAKLALVTTGIVLINRRGATAALSPPRPEDGRTRPWTARFRSRPRS